MKNFVLLITVMAAIGCTDDYVDPCETRNLDNDFIEMSSFLNDNENNAVKMISNDGRIENINIWRSSHTTNIIDSTECWNYSGAQLRLVVNSTFLNLSFQFYITPSTHGEILKFDQNVPRHEDYLFEYLLGNDSTLRNQFRTYENGEYEYHYPKKLSVNVLDTFSTQWKTFYGVQNYHNSIEEMSILPNKAIQSMVVDSIYGLVQFTTKSGETWDINYD